MPLGTLWCRMYSLAPSNSRSNSNRFAFLFVITLPTCPEKYKDINKHLFVDYGMFSMYTAQACERHTDDSGEYKDSDQVANYGENVPKRKNKKNRDIMKVLVVSM